MKILIALTIASAPLATALPTAEPTRGLLFGSMPHPAECNVRHLDTVTGDDAGDEFGGATALSENGEYLAVGANGYARVFKWSDGAYMKYQDIDQGGKQEHDAVAMNADGTIIVVGHKKDTDSTGKVIVYERRDDGVYAQHSALEGDSKGDEFGTSVALSANGATLVVGAEQGGESVKLDGAAGYARVFTFNDGAEKKWDTMCTLSGSVQTTGDQFGDVVAISGDAKVIGVSTDQRYVPTGKGYAQLYHGVGSSDEVCERMGEGIEGKATGEQFGDSMALNFDGSVLTIGAPSADMDRGLVRVYDVGLVHPHQHLQVGDDIKGMSNMPKGEFAESLALDDSGKVLVVGAKHGYAMTYHLVDGVEVAGTMIDGTAAEEYGDQVDISGNGHVIAVSAPQQDTGGAGYVKVYVREGAGCPAGAVTPPKK